MLMETLTAFWLSSPLNCIVEYIGALYDTRLTGRRRKRGLLMDRNFHVLLEYTFFCIFAAVGWLSRRGFAARTFPPTCTQERSPYYSNSIINCRTLGRRIMRW